MYESKKVHYHISLHRDLVYRSHHAQPGKKIADWYIVCSNAKMAIIIGVA